MQKNRWWLLQLFADGGEGSAAGGDSGAAADTGVNSDVAAGHQRLRELGVPEGKIRKNRSYKVSAAAKAPVEAGQAAEQSNAPTEQDDAASKPTEGKRMTWDEIKADPEYGEQLNAMMRDRVKKSKGAETAMEQLRPAIQALAKVYGMDHENVDYAALAGKITDDDRLYEEKSLEKGLAPDVTRKLEQFDLLKEREAQTVQEKAMQQHYSRLLEQGDSLKAKFPGFDLQAELKNPAFARMVAPGVGLMSVEEAYYAVHRKEIEEAAAKAVSEQTAKNMANAIRSGTMRPQENGAASSAPSVSSFSYRNASKAERDALKQRIRQAGARGEKIYPGQ